MKQRILLYDDEASKKLKFGINKLANMVKVTLGPKGNNVIIERANGTSIITKDGVTVAREVYLEDPIENIGAQLLKEVASKTNETAGDGTTTATVLAQSLVTFGIKFITAGANPIDIKRGMDIAFQEVKKFLESKKTPISETSDLINIAAISANNDYEVGKLIAEAIEKVGDEGTVIIEESKGIDTYIDLLEGVQFDKGYTFSSFINKRQTMEVELINPLIFIYASKLSSVKEVAKIMDFVIQNHKGSLLVVADEFSDEVSKLLVLNNAHKRISCCAVSSPAFGDRRIDLLNDIAIATGTKIMGREESIAITSHPTSFLGGAKKVIIDKNKTVIVDGSGNQEQLKETIDQIKYLIDNTSTEFDKQKLQERLGKLTGGIASLKVGAPTETELHEKKMRIEDALHAVRAALEDGILPGGGVSLVRATSCLENKKLTFVKGNTYDQTLGVRVVKDSLTFPFLSICNNSGISGEVALNKVKKNKNFNYGYDALTEEFGDLLKLGVIDPVKVVKSALANAISISGMILTTKGIIAQSPEEKEYIDKLLMQDV